MLPWLFVVLVLLNAGLFFWGYEREKSKEPPPTPVPEGRYEIRLIGEVPQASPQDSAEAAADLPAQAGAAGEPAAGGHTGEAEVLDLPAAEVSGPTTGAAVGATEDAADEALSVDQDQTVPRSSPAEVRNSDAAPVPEEVPEKVVEPKVEGTTASTEQSVRDGATEQSDGVDATASDASPRESVGDQAPNTATDVVAGSGESPAETPAQGSDGLRVDELSVEAPMGTADGVGPRMSVPLEPSQAERESLMPGDSPEDTR